MLMTHLAASQYRYYRWLLAGAVGAAILLVSLYTRYYQEVKSIEQSQQTLATRTVGKIEQLLSPAQLQAERSMDMLEQPCENVSSTLRFRAAQNQALRAMLLVKMASSTAPACLAPVIISWPPCCRFSSTATSSWRCALRWR